MIAVRSACAVKPRHSAHVEVSIWHLNRFMFAVWLLVLLIVDFCFLQLLHFDLPCDTHTHMHVSSSLQCECTAGSVSVCGLCALCVV